MIRRSRISLNNSNTGKTQQLDAIVAEATLVVNAYIEMLWETETMSGKYVDFPVDTWLSARMQQCLGKQALEIVKSQRKKKKKTMPVFKGTSFTLDGRFFDFMDTDKHFDMFIRLKSIGNRISLNLPVNRHYHYNGFQGWERRNTIRLCCKHGKYFIEVFFEKQAPDPRTKGRALAIDIGYKKLIATSNGEVIGDDAIYAKISNKKQGSNAFKKALTERDEAINIACKQLDMEGVNVLYVEDLKSVKHETKGKLRKQFVNKLQRWSYPKVLGKLSMLCEEQGVEMIRVPPAYTSQRCSKCGVVCKSNRNGETYKCACGNTMDADINAAINILHLGEYGPQALNPYQ